MISVVLYGRNDAHGYNLHKRAALSLNSMALALTNSDDEIIFVDWNTPDSLPPFPVAIADTLTRRVWEMLRIIRVPHSVHVECSGPYFARSTIESVARNVAIRRMATNNKWVLSTNTDIILRCKSASLSSVVRDITSDYVCAPRFELPEWIWEGLPRSDPEAAQLQLSHLADGTPLRQIVKSYQFIGFDAPGDFQLIQRQLLEEVGCFDETMLRGWHVDSNLGRRLFQVVGTPEPISSEIEVFHCNHTRQQTHFHQSASEANDLNEYVWDKVPVVAKSGPLNWGLPNFSLEESTLSDYKKVRNSLVSSLTSFQNRVGVQDFSSEADRLAGVPFEVSISAIMDVLSTTQGGTRVAYLGTRPEAERSLRDLVMSLPGTDFVEHFEVGSNDKFRTWVIVDVTPPEACVSRMIRHASALSRSDRAAILDVLEKTGDLIDQLREAASESTYFLIVNAEANIFEECFTGAFDMLPVQFNSRVRRAKIKPGISSTPPNRITKVYARMLTAARRLVLAYFEPENIASEDFPFLGRRDTSWNDKPLRKMPSLRAFMRRGYAILSKPIGKRKPHVGEYSRGGIFLPSQLTGDPEVAS